ncbi:GNAT family N-acetyltransferase [Nocardia sp. SYP-A9097]|uniref:GNAT family N-acetyltransferase n=1 Tax=Nocardia sp. SYP-A9097 TaxID=2663237 RepID=UPI002814F27F|nr:GNAT family N-acetyltransferase [Nocardia sp. SYP-A9097]
MRLRPLRASDEQVVRAAHEEIARIDGFDFALGLTPAMSWPEYLAALDDYRHGVNLPVGIVPATFLVATIGDEIVGRAAIRHTLNDHLRQRGGHIGYAVLLAYRRRGYGTQILRESVQIARRIGIGDILISCEETNIGSRRIIESGGGRFDSAATWHDGNRIRHYWIK